MPGKGVNRELLKTLQDVDWSEEEASQSPNACTDMQEEQDCMVCAETLDLSDLNFKPCQCGLQICQFCYNRLLSTDARCPGCRRTYDAKAVIFQPVDVEE
jgi:CCR4-NOT transcription complex subunit 4